MSFEVIDGIAKATDEVTGALEKVTNEKSVNRMLGIKEGLTPLNLVTTPTLVSVNRNDVDDAIIDSTFNGAIVILGTGLPFDEFNNRIDWTSELFDVAGDFDTELDQFNAKGGKLYNVRLGIQAQALDAGDAPKAIAFATLSMSVIVLDSKGKTKPSKHTVFNAPIGADGLIEHVLEFQIGTLVTGDKLIVLATLSDRFGTADLVKGRLKGDITKTFFEITEVI